MAHPSATVAPLRDRGGSTEALLVRRNSRLSFHGGAWVFPGGRIDDADYAGDRSDVIAAARRAAVREAAEEAGLSIRIGELVEVSRWVTPEGLPKRFDTWFFAAPTSGEPVRVDGGEILAYRWFRPDEALAAQRAGEIELPPPTFVTLLRLASFASAEEALRELARSETEHFLPRLRTIAGGACTVYFGDAAYDDEDAEKPGPRHRLVMIGTSWRYERSG